MHSDDPRYEKKDVVARNNPDGDYIKQFTERVPKLEMLKCNAEESSVTGTNQ